MFVIVSGEAYDDDRDDLFGRFVIFCQMKGAIHLNSFYGSRVSTRQLPTAALNQLSRREGKGGK